jgi:hypothetical protein
VGNLRRICQGVKQKIKKVPKGPLVMSSQQDNETQKQPEVSVQNTETKDIPKPTLVDKPQAMVSIIERSEKKEIFDLPSNKVMDFVDSKIQDINKNKDLESLSIQFFVEDSQPKAVLPQLWLDKIDLLSVLAHKICDMCKIKVAYIPYDVTFSEDQPSINKFITGLIIGFTETSGKTTLVKHNDPYELGRKTVLALRYKAHLKGIGVPDHLIVKNNAFLENQPMLRGEKVNKVKPFLQKSLLNHITDVKISKLIRSLLLFGCETIQLREFSEEWVSKCLTPLIIPFGTYVRKFYRVKGFTKQQRLEAKKSDKLRKPMKPQRSNVYNTEELKFINKFISPYWKSHKPLQSGWCENLLKKGIDYFEEVEQTLKSEYDARWEILEGFAKASNKRLKRFRKVLNNRNLKKREITSLQLNAFYESILTIRPFLVYDELKIIAGKRFETLSMATNKDGRFSKESLISYICANLDLSIQEGPKIKTYLDSLKQGDKEISEEDSRISNRFVKLWDFIKEEIK